MARGTIRVPGTARVAVRAGLAAVAQLLPDNFQINNLDLDVTTATTAFSLRGVVPDGERDRIRPNFLRGRFLSPRRSCVRRLPTSAARPRGRAARLTIAGIPLARGLDLEALTIDLSHLPKRRLGIDLHLDTYGGTLARQFRGTGG